MLGLMVAIGALGLQAAPAFAADACDTGPGGKIWQHGCTAGGVLCDTFYNGAGLKICFASS